MKVIPGIRLMAFLALGWALFASPAEAQNGNVTNFLTISATGSVASVPVNGTVTYTVGVTNISFTTVSGVLVTNSFSMPVIFVGATNFYLQSGANIFTNSSGVVVGYNQIVVGTAASFALTVQPTTAGTLVDTVSASAPAFSNSLVTTVTTVVSNAQAAVDLAVSIDGPPFDAIVGDYLGFGMKVRNTGSSAVSSVTLSNTFSSPVVFLSPTNLASSFDSNGLAIGLGTLGVGAVTNIVVRVEPTNVGPLTVTASVSAVGTLDLNPTNSIASTNIVVGDYLSTSNLVAVTNSAQQLYQQLTLLQQHVLVSNVGSTDVVSLRLLVSGLGTNRLFNAVGTNAGDPFVVYPTNLAAGQAIDLLMQYAPSRIPFPLTNGQLSAFEIPPVNITAPSGLGTPVALYNTNIVHAPLSGDTMLQFRSLTNRYYLIVYYDSLVQTNGLVALPPVLSRANWVQWVDYGPPATTSLVPLGQRYYYVYLLPGL